VKIFKDSFGPLVKLRRPFTRSQVVDQLI